MKRMTCSFCYLDYIKYFKRLFLSSCRLTGLDSFRSTKKHRTGRSRPKFQFSTLLELEREKRGKKKLEGNLNKFPDKTQVS